MLLSIYSKKNRLKVLEFTYSDVHVVPDEDKKNCKGTYYNSILQNVSFVVDNESH